MIRENQRLLNNINILTDALILLLSIVLAYLIRFYLLASTEGHLQLVTYLRYGLVLVPVYLMIYGCLGLYESFRSKDFHAVLSLIIQSNIIGFLLFLTILFIFKEVDISRLVLFFLFILNTLGISAKRILLKQILKYYRAKGYNQKHILVVGSGDVSGEYIRTILENKHLGYSISGYITELSDNEPVTIRVLDTDISCLGTLDTLSALLDEKYFDEVVCALDLAYYNLLPNVVNACENSGLKVSVIPPHFKSLPTNPYIDNVCGIPLMNIRRIPLDNVLNAFCKRSIDIIGSSILIVLSSPIMLFAAVGTKLSSPGPIIFKQVRVGLNKKTFTMYKFRSMRRNIAETSAWTTNDDPRKTKFGAFIRKYSIDELPQFFNVLSGKMSLVGPRPELPIFVDKFKESTPLYMIRHQVRPGITGWAQVNGLRGDTSIDERIKYDLYYIENWSLIFDIKILFMTLFGGIKNSEH